MTIVRKSIALICAWAALAAPPHALAVPAATAPVFPAPYVQSTLTSGNAVTANVTNPVTSGLVAEYPMTEGSGTVVHDISGNGNTANFASGHNPTGWTTWGVQFNGGTNLSWGTSAVIQAIQTPIKTFGTVLIHACKSLAIATQNIRRFSAVILG